MHIDNVAILGTGNLGNAIAEGLLSNGKYEPENIYVTRRNTKSLQRLKDKGLHVTNDNSFAVRNCRYKGLRLSDSTETASKLWFLYVAEAKALWRAMKEK